MSKGMEINGGQPNFSSVIQEANRLGWQAQDLRDGKVPNTERFKAQLQSVVTHSLQLIANLEGRPAFQLEDVPSSLVDGQTQPGDPESLADDERQAAAS